MKVLDLEGLGYFWTKIKNKFYIKPDTGIPKSDLSSEVQGSLNKADTALLTETDPIFTASPAHGISSEDIIYWDNKLEKLSAVKIIGSMYRTNVSGSGSISIQGNVGLFPVVLEAGTYTVVTDMLSNTNSYGLSVNCGGNTYTLNTTDGHIHDSREITIPANGRWSGTVIGSVAGNSMISVKIEKVADEVTEIALVGITNDYNDLDNKPILTNYFDGAVYDSNTKRINFKNGNVVKAYIDATAFIKDGMVDNVEIEDGKLIITFNTESGKEPIELDITAIFDPSNYYDKSTIDDFLDDKANVADLATVATSGEYSDLINPPTNVSDFTNDAGYLTEHQSLSNYYTKSETDDLLDDKADISDLATVATSGDYNDLTNKPTIPSAQVNSDWNATSGVAQILNKPDIPNVSQVANTGTSITVGSTSYNVVTTYSPSGNANTYTAPSWSAMDNACGELDFRTHIDDTSIGVNTDDELYVKSLSADKLTNGTNNKVFTASELTKLAGIAAGAEVNVQSDWDVSDNSSSAYIKNKPNINQTITGGTEIRNEYGRISLGGLGFIELQGNYVDLSDGKNSITLDQNNEAGINITANDGSDGTISLTASSNISVTPGTNSKFYYNNKEVATVDKIPTLVQSDWAETNNTSYAYIKNKPDISVLDKINYSQLTLYVGNNFNKYLYLQSDDGININVLDDGDINLNTDLGGVYFNNKEIATKNDIPTNVSAFTNDAGYLTSYTETDPTVPAWAKASTKPTYTAAEVGALPDTTVIPDAPGTLNTNNSTAQTVSSSESLSGTINLHKISKTGSYNDLLNKPTIPTVNNSTITILKNGSTVNSFTLNQSSNKTINITVPTTASDVSALPASTKYGASLSVSMDSTTYVVTALLKDLDGNNLGTAQTIDLPLESVVVSGSYDSATKKVILTLKDGSTIDFSIADLISGLLTEITSTNKLSADLVENGTTNKVYTATEKTKLSGIASGAEVNVQSNWNETNTSSDAYILNKPTIPQILDHPQGTETDAAPSVRYVENIRAEVDFRLHVDGTSIDVSADDDLYVKSLSADKLTNGTNNKVFTSAEQLKLTGIEIGAQVNVQSDWNETNVLSDAYILNKPTIPDITGKADKVSSAVEGNFASLDSNGNLEDSGYSYTDCLNELSNLYAPATESSELEPGDTFEEAFGKLEKTITDNEYVIALALNDLNTNKQDTLESGINIKTINGESILGSGDFNVTGDCIAYPSFEIDSNGHLIMSGGQQGLFTLENGHLMYNF